MCRYPIVGIPLSSSLLGCVDDISVTHRLQAPCANRRPTCRNFGPPKLNDRDFGLDTTHRRSGNLISVLTADARLLGDAERGAVERLLDRAPIAAAPVAEQVAAHGLDWWRADARIFGYGA